MDKEIFKGIPGYDGIYEVSNYGRVKSFKRKTPKILKPAVNHAGYLFVALSKDGKVKQYKVHRLVLMTFNPIENMEELQVNHKDEIKTNNHLDNLEWVTPLENTRYGTGIQRKAQKLKNNKRSKAVRCIETGIIYPSLHEAERQTGANHSSISRSCNSYGRIKANGLTWEWII